MTRSRGGDQFIPRPGEIGSGTTPRWHDLPNPARFVTKASLAAVMGGSVQQASIVQPPGLRDAAVLVPAYEGPSGVELLFVKRPASARTHAGQIAFPGGMREPEDLDLERTALREAYEEVGVDPNCVEIIARLGRTATVTAGTVVTPFVGWIEELGTLRHQESEVEKILHVPVAELLYPDTYRSELWQSVGLTKEVHFFEIEGETIWGLTAGILRRLFDALFEHAAEGSATPGRDQ